VSVKIQIDGLAAFRTALRNLPDDLTQEAGAIVLAHAEDAKQRVQGAYPEGPTGNLRRGVTMNKEASNFGARAIVRSRAPHAWLFEHGVRGTAPRRTVPPDQEAIPIFIRVRRNMVTALIHMVQRAGLVVTES